MRLVLLRHGRTCANERRLYCGVSDVGLSPTGREELQKLRGASFYPDIRGLALITSGMRRTDETLRLLFGAEPDARLPELREMNFGSFELHGYEELKELDSYQAWITDETGDAATPGGESANEFHERIFAAADQLAEDCLVVCHGGVIAALMARWFPGEGKNMYQWQPGFGLGYEVKWEDGFQNYTVLAPGTE